MHLVTLATADGQVAQRGHHPRAEGAGPLIVETSAAAQLAAQCRGCAHRRLELTVCRSDIGGLGPLSSP